MEHSHDKQNIDAYHSNERTMEGQQEVNNHANLPRKAKTKRGSDGKRVLFPSGEARQTRTNRPLVGSSTNPNRNDNPSTKKYKNQVVTFSDDDDVILPVRRRRSGGESMGLPARKRSKPGGGGEISNSDSSGLDFSSLRRDRRKASGMEAKHVSAVREGSRKVFGSNAMKRVSFLRSNATGSNRKTGTMEKVEITPRIIDRSTRKAEVSSDVLLDSEKRAISPLHPSSFRAISETPFTVAATPAEENNEELKKLEEENRHLKERLNNYKNNIASLERETRRLKTANNAFADKVPRNQEIIKDLTLENESLRVSSTMESSRNEENEEIVSVTKSAQLNVEVKFLGIASCIEKDIQRWCRMEVQELCPWEERPIRNWKSRSEKSQLMGYASGEDGYFIPIPPLILADRHEYFTAYYRGSKGILSDMVNVELCKGRWSSIISEENRKECKESILSEKSLLKKVKNHTSEELNRLKRNARDKLMKSLGCKYMESRSARTKSSEEMEEKVKQRRQLLRNISVLDDDDKPRDLSSTDISSWLTKDVDQLACDDYVVREDIGEVVEDDFLFRSKLALHVLREFRGFNINSQENKTVQSSILLLARRDALIMTFSKCGNQEEYKGGETQKKLKKEFARLLPEATKQLLDFVCNFVRKEHENELCVLYGEDEDDPYGNRIRVATMVVELPSDKELYIAVRPSWFRKEISASLGNVMDCFIGKGTSDGSMVELHGDENIQYPDAQDVDDPNLQHDKFCSALV